MRVRSYTSSLSRRSEGARMSPALRQGPLKFRSRSSGRRPRLPSWPSNRHLWAIPSCARMRSLLRCSRVLRRNRLLTWSGSTPATRQTRDWMRREDLRAKLARGFGRQALEALQVVLVVVERDPKVAVDGELAELRVHADATPLLLAQSADEIDEPVAGVGPFSQGCLQRDAVEVPLVVAVVLELG